MVEARRSRRERCGHPRPRPHPCRTATVIGANDPDRASRAHRRTSRGHGGAEAGAMRRCSITTAHRQLHRADPPRLFSARRSTAGADVLCLVDHDPGALLGRTERNVDARRRIQRGLAFTVSLPDTQLAQRHARAGRARRLRRMLDRLPAVARRLARARSARAAIGRAGRGLDRPGVRGVSANERPGAGKSRSRTCPPPRVVG